MTLVSRVFSRVGAIKCIYTAIQVDTEQSSLDYMRRKENVTVRTVVLCPPYYVMVSWSVDFGNGGQTGAIVCYLFRGCWMG